MDLSIADVVKMSPPVALAVAINFILKALKASGANPRCFPLLALLIGAIGYPAIAEIGSVSYSVRSPLIFNAIVGMCVGGLSIAFHQVFKQATDAKHTRREEYPDAKAHTRRGQHLEAVDAEETMFDDTKL